jgi:acyl-coenzyme A synthetase/AMP-(fatty) acid ligase
MGESIRESLKDEIAERNRRLPDFKRVAGYIAWERDFPRTASMKIKRPDLGDLIRKAVSRTAVKEL